MNNQIAYVVTGNLAVIVWILAIIGTITVSKTILKIVYRVLSTKTLQKSRERVEKDDIEYYNSTYYLSTKNTLNDVIRDKGLEGEYNIFEKLQRFENNGARFLFNCYLPKEHNETTESDVILLTYDGIFVFESKNYNGWIYGSEEQDLWTQTLRAGNKIHKTHFYNPVRQNKTHIKYLKKIIGDNLPIYSVIVFSNECILKDVKITDPLTKVIYLNHAITTILNLSSKTPNSISQEKLISIYDQLYPYTQVSNEIKLKHIENINKMRV